MAKIFAPMEIKVAATIIAAETIISHFLIRNPKGKEITIPTSIPIPASCSPYSTSANISAGISRHLIRFSEKKASMAAASNSTQQEAIGITFFRTERPSVAIMMKSVMYKIQFIRRMLFVTCAIAAMYKVPIMPSAIVTDNVSTTSNAINPMAVRQSAPYPSFFIFISPLCSLYNYYSLFNDHSQCYDHALE